MVSNNKSRILIFIDWYIPAYKAGGPIRSVYNLITKFKSDYEFYVITSDRDLGDTKPFINIKTNKWTDVEGIQVMYLSRKNYKIKIFKSLIVEVDPHIIYLNSLFSFNFTLVPLWLKKHFPDIKYVLAPRGMLGRGALSIKKKKKEVFIGVARLIKLYKGIAWHATNEIEKKQILKTFGQQSIIIIADNISSSPMYPKEEILKRKIDNIGVKRFLFVGRIMRIKNVERMIQWFNDLDLDHQNYTLDIYGSIEDKKYYRELLQLIVYNPKIQFRKEVHHAELKEIYGNSHFFILPTKGENFGHVIIESLSYGCPVIISDKTPWRNLDQMGVGWDIPLDNNDEFMQTIEKCIEMSEDDYLPYTLKAFRFAKNFINRKILITAYRKLLAT
jgi:glycosyltransferase involved in cell wall biosynthesis